MNVKVIAEAGVNHNGDVSKAKHLIDVAVEAGADAVKFQSFAPAALATAGVAKAAYQLRDDASPESQRAMLERLALTREEEQSVTAYGRARGIVVMSTPFDLESLAFVTEVLNVPILKLSSGSLTNGPLLLAAARTGLPLILSTGMANLAEIAEALDLIAWSQRHRERPVSRAAFQGARKNPEAAAALRDRVTLLHCTTAYPTPPEDVNLKAMDTLAERFGLAVGYSDHTDGIAISLAAAARGATVIEKHFTLDRRMPGPDHEASLEPDALKTLVRMVRDVTEALGSGEKVPTAIETENAAVVRQSLVAKEAVAAGAPFTEANLGVKRPGDGASPMTYWDRLDTPAARAYAQDEIIEP